MASHLAAQDYLARLQATGLNFPSLGSPADLPAYASLGLPPPSHHKKNVKGGVAPPIAKPKDKLDGASMNNAKSKYAAPGLSIQPTLKPSDKKPKVNDLNYLKPMDKKTSVSSSARVTTSSPSIFTSPLSLASSLSATNTQCTQSASDSISGTPATSILR